MTTEPVSSLRVLFATDGDGLPAALAAALAQQIWGIAYMVTGAGTEPASKADIALAEGATGVALRQLAPTIAQVRGQQFDLSITLCDGLASF